MSKIAKYHLMLSIQFFYGEENDDLSTKMK